jgi:type IV pilus assembly protein PilV
MVKPMARSVRQRGASLLEVLVTLVVVVLGLLGLAGLHARLQTAELESYQRSQALLLMRDMASRISVNKGEAALYAQAPQTLGAGMTCPTANATLADRDRIAWCAALQGAAETVGPANTRISSLIGGRGCIEQIPGGVPEYRITVVWQGLAPVSAPPTTIACGADQYNATDGSGCTDDRCRRYVTTVVRTAPLAVVTNPF